jgi:signal transduction histidine kinase
MEELARDYHDKKISQQELSQTANALGYVTDSRIYVLLNEKITDLKFLDSGRQENPVGSQLLDDLEKILDGETLVRKKTFSDQLNMYVVFVGLPVYIDGTISGVILLFSPLNQVNKTLFDVYKIIWITAAVSLALASVVTFIISRRISKPIEHIQKVAASLAEGNFAGDLAPVGRDEIARLTETFNYMKNRLWQIEEMRKDFIANVSHELRTPLTSIRGFIQGILDRVIGPEEQEKYLRRAYEETGRLNRLVNDLLQLARLQSGNVKLNREIVQVGELIGEIVEEHRLLAEQRNISLHVEISGDNTTIVADRDKLKQIILNLLNNALKYSNEGGKVWINALKEDKKLIFKIKDNGPGIPEDELQYIFTKFHRVESSSGQQAPGTGLGLSIAKELVELHGGTIMARSAVGCGTEMIFALPGDGK